MLSGNGFGRSRMPMIWDEHQQVCKVPVVEIWPISTKVPSAGLTPTQPKIRQSITNSQKNNLYTGRYLAERTRERSSHGNSNKDQDRCEHRDHAGELGRHEPLQEPTVHHVVVRERPQDCVERQEVPFRHDVRRGYQAVRLDVVVRSAEVVRCEEHKEREESTTTPKPYMSLIGVVRMERDGVLLFVFDSTPVGLLE